MIFAFVLIGLLCIRIPIEEKALRAGLWAMTNTPRMCAIG
jgi:hypothetical protein